MFGSLESRDDKPFDERTRYDPHSPDSALKAASDHLVRAGQHTYGMPNFVSNTTNNYGPWQFPEKLIPLVRLNTLEGHTLPVHGDGSNIRDWIHVEDHAEALILSLFHGVPGATCCLGPRQEWANLEVVRAVCAALDRLLDAGFAVSHCTLAEVQGDSAGASLGMPANVERAFVPNLDGVSELLRRRSGHYNIVVLLGSERGGLPIGTREALEGVLADAILIDFTKRH